MRKLITSIFMATLVSVPLYVFAQSTKAGKETSAKTQSKAEQAIVQLIGKTYDEPQAKVRTAPIVLAGEYAVAGWLQGEKGGRALLKKHADEWQIVLCAGDGLRQEEGLIAAGVAPELAKQLVQQLQRAESRLPAATLAKFASFETHFRHVVQSYTTQPPASKTQPTTSPASHSH